MTGPIRPPSCQAGGGHIPAAGGGLLDEDLLSSAGNRLKEFLLLGQLLLQLLQEEERGVSLQRFRLDPRVTPPPYPLSLKAVFMLLGPRGPGLGQPVLHAGALGEAGVGAAVLRLLQGGLQEKRSHETEGRTKGGLAFRSVVQGRAADPFLSVCDREQNKEKMLCTRLQLSERCDEEVPVLSQEQQERNYILGTLTCWVS